MGTLSIPGPEVSDQSVRELAQVFKLMSDETRFFTSHGFISPCRPTAHFYVTDLCQRLWRRSQPAVSHHLALLRVSGLIEARREGKHNFYCVRIRSTSAEPFPSLFPAPGQLPGNKKYKFHDSLCSATGRGRPPPRTHLGYLR